MSHEYWGARRERLRISRRSALASIVLMSLVTMMNHRSVALCLSSLFAVSALAACHPCSLPTVPASTVVVSDPSGGPVPGLQVTAQSATGTVTFFCDSESSDAGATSDASSGLVPADGASGAPIAGTRCWFSGGLGNGPVTVRAQAPGFVTGERVVSMSELTQPTGCGFALNVSIVLQRQ